MGAGACPTADPVDAVRTRSRDFSGPRRRRLAPRPPRRCPQRKCARNEPSCSRNGLLPVAISPRDLRGARAQNGRPRRRRARTRPRPPAHCQSRCRARRSQRNARHDNLSTYAFSRGAAPETGRGGCGTRRALGQPPNAAADQDPGVRPLAAIPAAARLRSTRPFGRVCARCDAREFIFDR
jgi:hypothetical protein